MAPKADGGGSVDVTPDEVNSAAGVFAKQQDQLGDVWSDLASTLNPGMAGNDGGAQKFAARYDPAARAVWRAFGSAVRVIGGTAQGLVATANNYVKAEEHSTTGHKPGPAKYPLPPVADDITVGGPDPAKGAGHSSVPDWLAQYWPNGDPDQLRAAATAWRTARDGVRDVTMTLHGAVVGITDYNNADDIVQMEAFWDTLAKPSDKNAVLTGLHDACDSIAKACDAYAKAIDDARSNLETALAEAGIAVALTTAIGILLTPITFGGSDVAAGAADAAEVAAIAAPLVEEFETTVAAEVSEAIAEDVAIDLEATAEAVPDIQAAEAEAEDVDAIVDQELEQTEAASGDEPPSVGKFGTKTDRLKEHLTDRDLDAARRELDGEVVKTRPDGKPYDHVDEVRNAQRGLVKRIQQIQQQLGDSRISDAYRVELQSELSEASRLLDHSEQFVPRG
jgi:putative RNase toxin 28 of polymorphic toxin system